MNKVNIPEKLVPEVTSNLRKNFVRVPDVIRNASGIRIFGKRLKSFIFTTDVAIIKNTNADAVIPSIHSLHNQRLLKRSCPFQTFLLFVVLVED